MKVDIVIPFKLHGSKANNIEIKLAVKSIRRFFKSAGNIIIVTDEIDETLLSLSKYDIEIITIESKCLLSRDSNIIEKLLAGIEFVNTDKFVIWSDDQCLIKEIDIDEMIPIVKELPKDIAILNRIWFQRLLQTLNMNETRLFIEPHCPLIVNTNMFKEIMSKSNYQTNDNIIIYTYYINTILSIIDKDLITPLTTPLITIKDSEQKYYSHVTRGKLDNNYDTIKILGYSDASIADSKFKDKLKSTILESQTDISIIKRKTYTRNDMHRVVQLTLDGILVKEYNCCQTASNTTNTRYGSIRGCCECKKGYKSANGYRWMYKSDYIKLNK